MMRNTMLAMAAVVAAGVTSATAANAAPFGYGPPDRDVAVERVAGGCGPGFHPNPWGRCRPNERGWGRGDGYGYGGPRGYGYGYGGGRGGYGGPDRGYGGPRRLDGGW